MKQLIGLKKDDFEKLVANVEQLPYKVAAPIMDILRWGTLVEVQEKPIEKKPVEEIPDEENEE